MESTPVVAKKLWNMVRVMFFMLRKGIAKSRIMAEFNLALKRGKKALLNHHSHGNTYTFISPRDYEFSCSSSPALKRHNKRRFSSHHHDVSTFAAVQKVLEILNNESNINSPLPGFGKSPIGKQLRVTDSPFPLTDQGDTHVDVAAQEFINNFYKDLILQTKMAPLDSPYCPTYWNR